MVRFVFGFVVGVLVAYLIGAAISTQFVLAEVVAMGLPVGWPVRWNATVTDLIGLAGAYLPLIAVACLIGFLVCAVLLRWFGHRVFMYALAGFCAVIAMHLIMNAVLGMAAFAAVRSTTGLLAQGLAGALGGWVFARMTAKPRWA